MSPLRKATRREPPSPPFTRADAETAKTRGCYADADGQEPMRARAPPDSGQQRGEQRTIASVVPRLHPVQQIENWGVADALRDYRVIVGTHPDGVLIV